MKRDEIIKSIKDIVDNNDINLSEVIVINTVGDSVETVTRVFNSGVNIEIYNTKADFIEKEYDLDFKNIPTKCLKDILEAIVID